VIGVTGTNGKTTIATLLFDLFSGLGYNCGLISTVENKIGEEVKESTHTTPDAIQIQALLAEMLKKGCSHCFMEVSSHAIDQRRIFGIEFDGAVFTNISHDHLDYHNSFEEYINAKKLFFDILQKDAFALVNVDDKRGRIMLQNTRANKKTYAIRNIADYKAKVLSNTLEGLELNINQNEVWFKLIGDFNAYNLLAVYASAIELGEIDKDVLTLMSEIDPAPGRFEQLQSASGVLAIVDYAHTPDALKNVLLTIKTIRTGNEKVITVVGCGGDRDKEKRPKMASVACNYSDKVILTSDNPRNENPETIIEDMQKGVSPTNYKKTLTHINREEAIKTACMLAENHDIILVAGKGHEDYQEIKGVRHPFDDKLVLGKMLELTKN
jgi:UDP-N-acetylmuramoyl-L-alanyl-D-glutamate--2,6-diaminopimelate ligase